MELQASWENILAVLSAEENPLTLQGLSERLPLSPSTIHRHLSALVEAGFVTRQGHRKTAAYVLRERLAVSWTGRMPPGQRQEEGWLRMAWTCNGRVDWRFPLITRVPDVQAQVTLQRFFAEALERGLLTPWLLPRLTQRRQEEKTKRSRRDPYWRHLKDSRDNHGLTFAVYGSCATGEARADSDLDLLILGPDEGHNGAGWFLDEIGFDTLAAEMNLGATRPIHVASHPIDHFWSEMPRHFRNQVLKQAITVHTTKPGGDFLEALRDEP